MCCWFPALWPLASDDSLPQPWRRCLRFPGGDHGSAGAEVSGSKQDCLLHHGGGGRREASDWPSGGIQANVRACSSMGTRAWSHLRSLQMSAVVDWIKHVNGTKSKLLNCCDWRWLNTFTGIFKEASRSTLIRCFHPFETYFSFSFLLYVISLWLKRTAKYTLEAQSLCCQTAAAAWLWKNIFFALRSLTHCSLSKALCMWDSTLKKKLDCAVEQNFNFLPFFCELNSLALSSKLCPYSYRNIASAEPWYNGIYSRLDEIVSCY